MLPLLKRELCIAARRPSTFRLRSGFGGGVMAFSAWAMLVWGSSPRLLAGTFFYVLFGVTAAAMLGTGLFVAVDAVSLERREGTLPLLFLTDLTTAELVVGKLVAVSITPFFTLLSVLPSLGIWQLVGGLSVEELVRAVLVLLVTLFTSTSLSLFASSVLRERWQVVLGSILLLLLFNPLWLVIGAVLLNWWHFWFAIVGFVLLGLLFLYATGIVLRRNWRDELGVDKERPAVQARGHRRGIETNLITSLLLRTAASRSFVQALRWAIAGLAITLVLWLLSYDHVIMALDALFLVHLACILSVTARTAWTFSRKREDGEFELLLSTPLTNEELFLGFVKFLHIYSRPFLALLSGFDGLIAALLWFKGMPRLIVFPLAMAAVVWITLAGVSWVGVYRSFMQSRPIVSAFWTFWRLSLFPILLSALFLWAPRTDYQKVCFFWVFSTGFLALFFSSDARRVLLERGRELLLRPNCEKPPYIESQWSFINWEGLAENEKASPGGP
jgi:hypothetical protein